MQLDIHAREDRDQGILGEEEGLSLARLVELFSRAGKQEPNHWRLEAGPVRPRIFERPLAELRFESPPYPPHPRFCNRDARAAGSDADDHDVSARAQQVWQQHRNST